MSSDLNDLNLPSELDSSIDFLEQSNPSHAYFSYTTDPMGEFGMISANEEGLRLYAAELLRIARHMKNFRQTAPLHFNCREWMVSDTGYDLITGVIPQFKSRKEILAERPYPQDNQLSISKSASRKGESLPGKGCLGIALFWVLVSLILFASVKGLPNLQSWVNIH